MAQGGFFSRLSNLWGGFLSLFVGNLEKSNPEAVYEATINARKKQYADLKKAVSGIIVLRNKLAAEHEEKVRQAAEIEAQIQAAVESDDDEVALVLLEQKEELDSRIGELEADLEKAKSEAEDAKASIISFQAEIEKLEREKTAMLARKETAEARIQIQEQLDGLSMKADLQALDNVRDHIQKLQAEADVGQELADNEIGKRLDKIKARATSNTAKAKLEALKKARETKQSEGLSVKQSM